MEFVQTEDKGSNMRSHEMHRFASFKKMYTFLAIRLTFIAPPVWLSGERVGLMTWWL